MAYPLAVGIVSAASPAAFTHTLGYIYSKPVLAYISSDISFLILSLRITLHKLQLKNIISVSVTFVVLNEERSKVCKFLLNENIFSISVTFAVLKLERSKFLRLVI